MLARLVSLDGHEDIPLDRVMIVVGRHSRCDVRTHSIRVSRRHCCLALVEDGVLVRDLGSTNGTWINGRPIEVAMLRPGDELAIAHHRYALEIDAAGQMSPTLAGRWLHGSDTVSLPGIDAATPLAPPPPGRIPPDPSPPDVAPRR